MSESIRYRPEIDGLRAIAVLAVVVFHINADWLPGGFLGVDVFFVISGYLITSILLRDLQAGKLSLAHFYERRARRRQRQAKASRTTVRPHVLERWLIDPRRPVGAFCPPLLEAAVPIAVERNLHQMDEQCRLDHGKRQHHKHAGHAREQP
jgi:hypothetical protein